MGPILEASALISRRKLYGGEASLELEGDPSNQDLGENDTLE